MDIMMGFEFIVEPFKYDFMVRSMYVAILVGIMLPLLGAVSYTHLTLPTSDLV